jgi:dTMP kinase
VQEDDQVRAPAVGPANGAANGAASGPANENSGSIPERGRFITFEGGEGAGKSTQIRLLQEALQERGIATVVTREPGGSPGAEAVRVVLLSGAAEPLGPEMEAILFAAARSDHVETVIRPALIAGKTVLCDRFFDSTRVYQGATGDVDRTFLRRLEEVACEDCWPDLTIILDLEPEVGMRRALDRRSMAEPPDRFEKETLAKQQQRREAYLQIADAEPQRCTVIDASGTREHVHRKVLAAVLERLWPEQPGPDRLGSQQQQSAKRRRAQA